MWLMPSQNLDYKMNEQKVKDLVSKLKLYVNQLESELSCTVPRNYTYNASLHEEIKLFEEWYNESDETLCH